MGKKNKLIKRATRSMKILKSGKIKIEGEHILDLAPLIKKSSKEATVSRLNGIISKEDVVLEEGGKVLNVQTVLQSQMKTVDIQANISQSAENYTVVVPIKKKSAIDIFDFLADGVLGDILRSSTLASTYKKIKKEWVTLNKDDTTSFTNVMYVPDVAVFMDPDEEKLKRRAYYINVLILALPSKDMMIDDEHPKISNEDASARTIADILEASIRVHAKKLIIDPFNPKVLRKDCSITASLWNEALWSNRVKEQIDDIIFSFEEESKFIVFSSKVMKDGVLGNPDSFKL